MQVCTEFRHICEGKIRLKWEEFNFKYWQHKCFDFTAKRLNALRILPVLRQNAALAKKILRQRYALAFEKEKS